MLREHGKVDLCSSFAAWASLGLGQSTKKLELELEPHNIWTWNIASYSQSLHEKSHAVTNPFITVRPNAAYKYTASR